MRLESLKRYRLGEPMGSQMWNQLERQTWEHLFSGSGMTTLWVQLGSRLGNQLVDSLWVRLSDRPAREFD